MGLKRKGWYCLGYTRAVQSNYEKISRNADHCALRVTHKAQVLLKLI